MDDKTYNSSQLNSNIISLMLQVGDISSEDVKNMLNDAKKRLRSESSQLLFAAIKCKNKKMIKALLQYDDDNKSLNTFLELFYLTVHNDDKEAIKLLLQCADKKLLLSAVQHEGRAVMRLFLKYFDESKSLGLLKSAIQDNDEITIKLFLQCSDEKLLLSALQHRGKAVMKLFLQCSNESKNLKLLSLAMQHGNEKIIKLFVRRNYENENLKLLQFAMHRGDKEVIDLFVKYGNNKLLFSAIQRGDMAIIRLLIRRGNNYENLKVLDSAIQSNDEEVVKVAKLFMQYGSEALMLFILESGGRKITKSLLQSSDDNKILELLHLSIKCENSAVIKLLFQHNDKSDNLKLLCLAVHRGDMKVIQAFLQYGDKKENISLLKSAIKHGYKGFIEACLQCNYEEYNLMLLCLATKYGDREVVELCLRHVDSIDFNISYNHNHFLHFLHFAVPKDRGIFLIEELSENYSHLMENDKIDVNIKNDQDQTPLHIAAYQDKILWIKYLLNSGADACIKDKHGNTPLYLVAKLHSKPQSITDKQRQSEAVGMFLDSGKININQRVDNLGNTLLHLAVMGNNEFLVSKLLEYGANPYIKNNMGYTPLYEACECSCSTIVNIMKASLQSNKVTEHSSKAMSECTQNVEQISVSPNKMISNETSLKSSKTDQFTEAMNKPEQSVSKAEPDIHKKNMGNERHLKSSKVNDHTKENTRPGKSKLSVGISTLLHRCTATPITNLFSKIMHTGGC